jgi:heme/copper-type cytochrome/quinol oxidase subunit 3
MFNGALVAAYLALRAGTREWPPDGVEFDNYLGTTLTLTLLLSMLAMEWVVYAVRNAFRGQALSGLGITLGLAASFVVGIWYLVDTRLDYAAGDHSYGVMTFAMLLATTVSVLVAGGWTILSLLRVAGGQLSASNAPAMRANAWLWHFVSAAWIAAWLAIFVIK